LPRPQRLDDNLNFTRTPPLTNLLLPAFLPQNMPGDKTIEPEINIANNWHIIPTSGDLLANDTNDLAHFLSLHPFGSWPPKAPPRSNLQVTSFSQTFFVTLCSTCFSLTFALNNVYVALRAIVFVVSALAVIFHDFARQSPCASRCWYSTHFSLIRTLYALSMLSSASFSASSSATVLSLGFARHIFSVFGYLRLLLGCHGKLCLCWILCLCHQARVSLTGTW